MERDFDQRRPARIPHEARDLTRTSAIGAPQEKRHRRAWGDLRTTRPRAERASAAGPKALIAPLGAPFGERSWLTYRRPPHPRAKRR